MECEVCGRPIGKPHIVIIEGAEMKVCSHCARFGSPSEKKASIRKTRRASSSWIPYTKPIEAPEFVENYGEIIRKAREAMSLTREKLGEKISVKESVIARLETEKMQPNVKLAKKLEKALNIKLFEETHEEDIKTQKATKEELTLGDIVKIKKKS
jgi:putative transcription factor